MFCLLLLCLLCLLRPLCFVLFIELLLAFGFVIFVLLLFDVCLMFELFCFLLSGLLGFDWCFWLDLVFDWRLIGM